MTKNHKIIISRKYKE